MQRGTLARPGRAALRAAAHTAHARSALTSSPAIPPRRPPAEMGLSRHDVWGHLAPMFHLVDVFAVYALTLVGGRHVTLPAFAPADALLAIGARAPACCGEPSGGVAWGLAGVGLR